jgi:hypothetical protein
MSTDQVQVVHTDKVYDVTVTITERVREVVVGKDYRHAITEASTPRHVNNEVESMQFTTNDKEQAIARTIAHLNVIAMSAE